MNIFKTKDTKVFVDNKYNYIYESFVNKNKCFCFVYTTMDLFNLDLKRETFVEIKTYKTDNNKNNWKIAYVVGPEKLLREANYL